MPNDKILVMGAGGVGKSATTIQLVQHHFVLSHDPTIEDCYRWNLTLDNIQYKLEVRGTAAEEQYCALRDSYKRVGDGFVLMYSVTQASSLTDLDALRESIFHMKDSDNVPMILVGNKMDLEEMREVSTEIGQKKANEYQCPFFEISAKNHESVVEAFTALFRMMISKGEEKKVDTKTSGSRCIVM